MAETVGVLAGVGLFHLAALQGLRRYDTDLDTLVAQLGHVLLERPLGLELPAGHQQVVDAVFFQEDALLVLVHAQAQALRIALANLQAEDLAGEALPLIQIADTQADITQ
ncbi:hypothetical protein D3C81_2053500 [compost metagenome]